MNKRTDWSRGIHVKFPAIVGFCAFKCGKPLPKGRWRYCSDECGYAAYVEHNIARGNPAVIRAAIEKRDHGICQRCGKDTGAERKAWWENYHKGIRLPPYRHGWEAHHKIAVVEGGGVGVNNDMALDDFETLCLACHKSETKELHRRRRQSRRRPEMPELKIATM